MFKKFLATILVSTFLATSSYAEVGVSLADIEYEDISSNKFAKRLVNALNETSSEEFSKKVIIDVLKSAKKSKISIKNGTCNDYLTLRSLTTYVINRYINEYQFHEWDIRALIIMRDRIGIAIIRAKEKLKCN